MADFPNVVRFDISQSLVADGAQFEARVDASNSNSLLIVQLPASFEVFAWFGSQKIGAGIPLHLVPYLKLCDNFNHIFLEWTNDTASADFFYLIHGIEIDAGLVVS